MRSTCRGTGLEAMQSNAARSPAGEIDYGSILLRQCDFIREECVAAPWLMER